jgi:uncharacterized membrane protein
MAFFAFVCLALSALISGFKLAKQTYIWSEAPYTDTCVYIVVLHMFVCSVVYSIGVSFTIGFIVYTGLVHCD